MKQQGRVVIITGAAGGIGRALVDAHLAVGDIVVAADLPDSGVLELARGFGAADLGLEFDVSREEDILALYARIDAQFDHIDVLVNNAAMGPSMAATTETPIDDFRRAMAVNLIGPFLMAREAARRMQPGAAIVNVASMAGIIGNPKRNAYAASKAGLISVTKSLASELASLGIRVTAVAPGYVRTPMVAKLERAGQTNLAAVRSRVPMGRMARPDEIARAVRFLASPDAHYINGTVLTIDGGWMSFNQPGDAHPRVSEIPVAELSRPPQSTNKRIVLVTGGATSIGAAVVRRFAANGDTVVIADINGAAAVKLAKSLGGEHMGKSVDISSETKVVALFDDVRERFGRLEVLVNSSAWPDSCESGVEQTPAEIARVIDVNLTGAFTCAREAIKTMRPDGVILNIGSINRSLTIAQRHAYGASKAGLEMLTRCMAAELGPVGIRTATIALGFIHTPDSARKAISRRNPARSGGQFEGMANAAFFLASPDASYINGSTLYVGNG
ncbi:SDR family oxidoreductase (plasmid) [Rhizobium sp. CB3171]|uniref:SDR family oxidoreductase n=1 Tax=Rhizobium sp. CB3171 TaxID=3039157 RepID=UPI0024B08187|nr:SDR family oxidoreductase [Rhizobium sp. CB3171]WFU07097.1 SDR family oxidoreductase [Rhizobium sp. CB3171]